MTTEGRAPEGQRDAESPDATIRRMEAAGRWLWLSRHRDGWTAVFSSTQGKTPLHLKGEADTWQQAIANAGGDG